VATSARLSRQAGEQRRSDDRNTENRPGIGGDRDG